MKISRISGIVAAMALVIAVSSCSSSVRVDGTLADAPSSEVIVKLLDINKYKTIDTVATDASGKYKCKLDIAKGQPEFIYLFYKDTKIASLLLQSGDKVRVKSDTLGNSSVEGSEETLKLMAIEKEEAEISTKLLASSARLQDLSPNSERAAEIRKQMSADFIEYYRSKVKYVLTNSHSLTVIPVLYQVLANELPVFGQPTDAIHFRNVSDSLKAVYPESRYVKALRSEADRRANILNISARIDSAQEATFPDLNVTDNHGKKVRLSEVDAKMIMIYFWNPSDPAQTLFNVDVLLPIYNQYKAKGFEIYSVACTTDKASWASVVKNQKLPWINVCDGNGNLSVAAATYNIQTLPTSYFIYEGRIAESESVKDEATLKSFLASKMK